MSISRDISPNSERKTKNCVNQKSKRQDIQLYVAPGLRSISSVNQKSKRPDRQLYIAPSLRYKFKNFYEIEMENTGARNPYEDTNNLAKTFTKHESSQKEPARIVLRKLRFSSSSSSSHHINTSDESYKESCNSGDSEGDSGDSIRLNNLKIGSEQNPNNNSNCRFRTLKEQELKPAISDHEIELEDHYQNTTEKSSRNLMRSRPNFDVNSRKNQQLKFKSDSKPHEIKLSRRLFYSSDDTSVSGIEPISDKNIGNRNAMTSTPKSDVFIEKVLDAAKHVSNDENGSQPTLLGLDDTHEATVNANRNEFCDFEIYRDSASFKNHSPDFSDIFGNGYIPPPIPPPASDFQLPPIHRLPSPVSLPRGAFASHVASPQYMPLLVIQQRHPRHILSPSTRSRDDIPLCNSFPSNLSQRPQVFLSSMRPSSPIPSLRLSPERYSPPYYPQKRANPLYVNSYAHDDSFYIPPPIPPPLVVNRCHQINLYQGHNMSRNGNLFDPEIRPASLKR